MAKGTNIGKAFVQIVPSAEGIEGSITKLLGGESENAGKKSGLKIASFMKKAIAAAGIGMAIKKTMDVGKELEQNLGGTEAVFGKYASRIQEEAQTAYKNMGLSASDYMATANKMGSLFQGSGLSQQKSLQLTSDAMKRAADVASVMGIDTSMAMESIAGAAKGNFTMMDNLGVAMNATTLKAYALEKGINFDWNTASNAEKAELAMKMFMDKTSQYEGNFFNESEKTFSGSLDAMKASVQNLMGSIALGQNVEQAMSDLIHSASTFFFNNCLPMVGTMIKALPGAIATFMREGVPLILTNIGNLVSDLASKVATFADGITAEKVTEWAKTSGVQLLKKGGELLGKFVSGLLSNMGKLLGALGKIGLEIVKGLGAAIWPKITEAANRIKDKFLAPIEALKEKVKAIIDKIKGFFSFKVNIPHIPKPHFSISPVGWKLGDLLKGSIPKLGITWNDMAVDTPRLFTRATLFGAGETSDEIMYGRQNLMRDIEKASGGGIDYDKLAQALIRGLSGVELTAVTEIDGREVARSTAPFMQPELNRLNARKNRKLGVI